LIFTCPRQSLLDAISIVLPGCSSRPNAGILRNIQAVAIDGRLSLTSTDNDVTIATLIGVTVDQHGIAIFQSATLPGILRESNAETVTIEVMKSSIGVTLGDAFFSMLLDDSNDFPSIKDPDITTTTPSYKRTDLERIIDRVLFSSSKDPETKVKSTTGVLVECLKGSMNAIATDGHRIAVASTKQVSGTSEKPFVGVVPARSLGVVDKVLKLAGGDNVEVCINSPHVIFSLPNGWISCRLMEDRFPKWEQFFPKKKSKPLVLNVGVFLRAIMTDEESRILDFTFNGSRLEIESSGKTRGESDVVLDVGDESFNGFNLRFDPHYLISFLRVCDPDGDVSCYLPNDGSAAVFEHGEAFRYLVVQLIRG
jgi:DNA polymerase-3 subunit beta